MLPIPTSSRHSSPMSSPSTSPASSPVQERVNALLANFENGTHPFCRDDRPLDKAETAAITQAASTQQMKASQAAQTQAATVSHRGHFMSLLSLTRPLSLGRRASAGDAPVTASLPTRHFDPSRDPKLHHLI